MLVTILTVAVMAVAAGIGLAVVIKIIKNVMGKAKTQGVVLKDGVSLPEVALLAKLIQDEIKENADIEALKLMKTVVDKVMTKKGI